MTTCNHPDHQDPDRPNQRFHPDIYLEQGRYVTRYYACPELAEREKNSREETTRENAKKQIDSIRRKHPELFDSEKKEKGT